MTDIFENSIHAEILKINKIKGNIIHDIINNVEKVVKNEISTNPTINDNTTNVSYRQYEYKYKQLEFRYTHEEQSNHEILGKVFIEQIKCIYSLKRSFLNEKFDEAIRSKSFEEVAVLKNGYMTTAIETEVDKKKILDLILDTPEKYLKLDDRYFKYFARNITETSKILEDIVKRINFEDALKKFGLRGVVRLIETGSSSVKEGD